MKKLKSCSHMLHVLQSANPKLRKAILKEVPNDVIQVLSEICLNTLRGNVKVKQQTREKLKAYKGVLRQLASSSVGDTKKRRLLIQKGGFLGLLLGALLSGVLGHFINGAITKKDAVG